MIVVKVTRVIYTYILHSICKCEINSVCLLHYQATFTQERTYDVYSGLTLTLSFFVSAHLARAPWPSTTRSSKLW